MRSRLRGGQVSLAVLLFAAVLASASAPAFAAPCAKSDFEGVVETAAATLRELNQQNAGPFQGKLRALKDKRGWTQDQFVKSAAPFVRDDKIIEFDEQSEDLLARINGAGSGGQGAATADCKVLEELRSNMTALVDAQKAKWSYMFAKIDAELTK